MKDKPNILFFITDEQRADSLGFYNSGWPSTPNIDALAANGVVFEQAITPAPLCVPARTSMLSGRYPVETGCYSNPGYEDGSTTDLLARFASAGYATGSFGKHHYRGCAHQDLFQQQEDLILTDHVSYTHFNEPHDPDKHRALTYPSPYTSWLLGGEFPAPEEETAEARVVQRGIDYLESTSEPFFLRLSFNGPHTPAVPPARFLSRIDPDAVDLPGCSKEEIASFPVWLRDYLQEYSGSARLKPEEIRFMRHCYYAEVAFLDLLVGRVISHLRESGQYENTIVVFVSDHGTHLGDHCFIQKQTFFDPVVRVPYLIHFPRRLQPRRVSGPVSTISVLPTLMQLVGIDPPNDLETRGIGKALLLERSWQPSGPVFSEYTLESIKQWGLDYPHKLVMVRDNQWKLCFVPEDPTEGQLFNVQEDPLELDDRYHELRDSASVNSLKRSYELLKASAD